MPRRGAKNEPDLFTLPERNTQPVPLHSRPVLLPDDLVSSLRQLADPELKRLQAAVVNEVARRGLPARASDLSDQRERRGRTAAALKPASPGVTAGKANAIRAALRAGLKPATIARQFGVPQSVVRQVLQGEGRAGRSPQIGEGSHRTERIKGRPDRSDSGYAAHNPSSEDHAHPMYNGRGDSRDPQL